jgi:ABC-type glutathione transport system ATPase component
MSATSLALEVESLRKVFRVPGAGRGDEELVAVDNVSFTVARGGSLAVVGESGSGKTTVARMIVGLERPSAGRIVVAGQEWGGQSGAKARRARARAAQMVFQDPYSSLDPRQTVSDCVDEVLRLHTPLPKEGRRTRVRELLEQVGLDERHESLRPQALSGGQRQRVAIARALAAEPAVLILDEAVSALDVSVQGQVLNLLADLRSALGITYVFVSHDLAVVQQVSDEIVVMRGGEVVERGSTDDVLAAPQHEYTRRLMEAVPREGWVPRRSAEQLGRPVSRLVGMPDRPSPRRGTTSDTADEEHTDD